MPRIATRAKADIQLMAGVLTAAALMAGTGAATAREPKRLYTTIDLDACRIVKRHRDGNSWLCKGLPGYSVFYGEGDLRAFVSVGSAPAKRRAAEQTLGPFNSIFNGKTRRATVEWRVHGDGTKTVPHATILRYFTRNDSGTGEVLVVMKVGERETCQAAIIDARAAPQAIALARQVADSVVRSFACKDEPASHGKTGKSVF